MHSVVLRRTLLAGAAVTVTVLLSACGGAETSPSGSGTDPGSGMPAWSASASASAGAVFNDADVIFAQMMIEHHRQAIEMAELAGTRAGDPEVTSLAEKIKAAQQPEIDTMTGWLSAWGKPAAMPSVSGGMDTGGMSHGPMPGTMSHADMQKLMDATGADFDKRFLTMMIAHHSGAITMAKQETGQGINPDAKALAGKIISDQQAEITTMRGILNRL
jgi:uncharacterized protein (DUF305 family)